MYLARTMHSRFQVNVLFTTMHCASCRSSLQIFVSCDTALRPRKQSVIHLLYDMVVYLMDVGCRFIDVILSMVAYSFAGDRGGTKQYSRLGICKKEEALHIPAVGKCNEWNVYM